MFGCVINFFRYFSELGSIEVNMGYGFISANVPSKSTKRANLSSGFIILEMKKKKHKIHQHESVLEMECHSVLINYFDKTLSICDLV